MALVGYSDSEESDTEAPPAPKPSTARAPKEKLVETSGVRRIKVDLPAAAAAPTITEDRPVKRARTGGGFSGFNALLPAPKRAADASKKAGLGSGVSLKTSSAAAFSREPVAPTVTGEAESQNETAHSGATKTDDTQLPKPAEEIKVVGNPMRFKPLSVANKKKPKRAIPASAMAPLATAGSTTTPAAAPPAPSKPKVSLFSVSQPPTQAEQHKATETYEPLIEIPTVDEQPTTYAPAEPSGRPGASGASNSLDIIAADLNLSAADRRRLFGRGAVDQHGVQIANFDMDREYARNEQLRAEGEAMQHRAVRSVAPGKHSLQQLVNAASTQREALEDAWAQGKRNRNEAGNKYGWGR